VLSKIFWALRKAFDYIDLPLTPPLSQREREQQHSFGFATNSLSRWKRDLGYRTLHVIGAKLPLPLGEGATAFLRFRGKRPLPTGEGATTFLRFRGKLPLPLGEGWGEGEQNTTPWCRGQ